MFLAFVAAVVLLVGPAAMAVLSLTAPDLFGRLAQIDPLSATAALLSFFSWFKWPLWAITVALLGLIELARGIRFAP